MEHAKDHLHRLIRSMTGPEKRYFKVYSTRQAPVGRGEQLALFDAIAAMEQYDPAKLQRFKGGRSTDHFTTNKHRLYEAVLRSLSAYHTENSIDARLARSMHQIEILHDKALYADAERLLANTRRLALAHDRTIALLGIARWEQRLLEQGNYANASAEQLDELVENGRTHLAEEEELHTLWAIKSRVLMALYRVGQVRNADGSDQVGRLLDHPAMDRNACQRTARATFLYHHTKGAAAFAKGDLNACITHLEMGYATLERERPKFIEEPNLAFSTLSNLIYAKARVGHYAEAFALLQAFRTLPGRWNMPETADLDLKLFATTTSLELTIHNRMGEFEQALQLLPLVERGIKQFGGWLGPMRKASFYYQLAYAQLGAGRPDLALRWTHRLLNDIPIDQSAEIVSFGRLLDLIAHIDAHELDVLPYLLRNTARYLKTRKRMHRFEPLLLTMVRGIMKAPNNEARRRIYLTFQKNIAPLEADPYEHAVFDHLDPIAWVEAKLTGRPFAEVVKERAHRADVAA